MIATEVGYSQGKVEDPSYEDVCSGQTGHVEVVQLTYNSQEVRGRQVYGSKCQGQSVLCVLDTVFVNSVR